MNHKKLKILIISCYFPPLNLISSLRAYSWAKYWSRMGHEICVLTIKNEGLQGPISLQMDHDVKMSVKIVEIPLRYKSFRRHAVRQATNLNDSYADKRHRTIRKLIKKTKRIIRSFIGIDIYSPHPWVFPAIKKALELYRHWPFDIVVSTYSPAPAHIVGGILKRKTGVFWVADYRDLWYGNHYYAGRWPFSFFKKCMEDFFVKKADVITVVSDPWNEKLAARFGNKVITIENGFDTEALDKIGTNCIFPNDGKVRLVYTGRIYVGKQDTSPLFKAVCILKSREIAIEDKLEIIFYGFTDYYLQDIISKYNLNDIVKTPGFIGREAALQAQRDADMLIFLDWQDSSVDGLFTGKLFEYIYSGTPVLNISVSLNTSASKLIEASGIGFTVVNSPEKIADIIETLTRGEKLNYSPSHEVLTKYTRKGLAEKMLENIIQRYKKGYNNYAK